MKPKQKRTPATRPEIVATAHNAAGLRTASSLRRGEVDLVELRLDLLRGVRGAMPKLRVPVLLTARHPAEGGAKSLSAAGRRNLLAEFLPEARAVDVELRSVTSFQSLLREADRRGVRKIISFHDFSGTPSLPRLRRTVARAAQQGADIIKIATFLRGPRDLAVLLSLQASAKSTRLATMGMGPLGRISRLALAAAGSRLVYGYLDRAQVPGQWPAVGLRRRIAEVMP